MLDNIALATLGNIQHLNLEFSRKLNDGADNEEEPVFGRADDWDFEAA